MCGLAANNTTCVCVYKYFERLRHNAPDDRNPNTLKYKTTDKRVLWAKISCSSCDPALSVHDNVNHHQDSTRDQHDDKKTKAFYDWATTGISVKIKTLHINFGFLHLFVRLHLDMT